MANPTTNYGFVLPTSTDLVTDLPADFDVALQGVDTRLKALQPGTTSGDLAYSSATANTNVRLGIGTTSQVLSVVGGVPAWATPVSGASLLSTTALPTSGSTAAVDITSISQSFSNLLIYAFQVTSSGASEFTFNFRNGVTNLGTAFAGVNSAGARYNDNTTSGFNPSPGVTTTANTNFYAIRISNYAQSTYKPFEFFGGYNNGTNTFNYAGNCYSTSAINAIRISDVNAFFRGGTIQIYGVN